MTYKSTLFKSLFRKSIGLLLMVISWLTAHHVAAETHTHIVVTAPSDTSAWQLAQDKNDIQVYTRKWKGSSFWEVKAETIVEAPVAGMVALIKDTEVAPEWIDRLVHFEACKINSPTDWYAYAEISLPWPYENKDLITHNVVTYHKDGSVTVTLTSAPDLLPLKEGRNRMQHTKGSWRFIPHSRNRTKIIYTNYAEPEGLGLPMWVLKPIVVHGVHKSLGNIKNIVTRPKYQQGGLTHQRQP
jgi:hypothetical protein